MPDYWRPCVLAASTGKSERLFNACNFSPELAAVPGIVSADASAKPDETGTGEAKAPNIPIFSIGKGVTPPRVVFQRDPEFSDLAREAKYQGTIIVMLIVDKTGQARNIRIVRPLGLGLDQKAVATISMWRFDPAKKNGEPVNVEIAVEVSFRLY